MGGLKTKDEYIEVAKACVKHDFSLEPTVGIDTENFEEIIKIPLELGVKKIIPHIYTSIIDKDTGKTKAEDVEKLMKTVEKLLG